MSDLMLPAKGQSAANMLQELNADHAPDKSKGGEDAQDYGTNVTTLQETNVARNEGTPVSLNVRTKQREGEPAHTVPATVPAKVSRRGRAPLTGTAAEATSPDGSQHALPERAERYTRALEQAAEDEIAVVTVRISGRLNEYMDRYVERMNRLHPKRRYRKQDAVAEAFAAFYADHLMPPAPEEDDL